MKKLLKRTILVFLTLIALIIAAIIFVPMAFKPQLMELAKKEINNNLNANVEFKDFQVSMIKGFPNLYVGLKGLTVAGLGNFANDTLIAFDEFGVTMDLISFIKMKNIEVKSVLLEKPTLTARITHEGKVNWNIVKPSMDTSTVQPTKTKSNASSVKVALRRLEIHKGVFKYVNDSSNMSANISNLNFLLSGNMGADYSDLKIRSSIDALSFSMGGLRYLDKVNLSFSGEIGADIVSNSYRFKDNELSINAIVLNFVGLIKMPKEGIDVDINFETNKADFKSILSLVPAIYMKDFEKLQASGKVKLQGFAKGTYNNRIMPSAGIELTIENAMFKYPALPKSADNININTKVQFDGTNMDKTTIDVNQFHAELAGNPFDAQIHVSTPMSDIQIAGLFKGKVDFTSIANVIPLDSIKIKGLLESDILFSGKMSYLDKGKYEMVKADGTMRLTDFELVSPDLPQGLRIIETSMRFSPKFVDLVSFDSRIGRSDMKMNGRLENFIPFVLNKQTIKGDINITSSLLDANEFLTSGKTPTDTIATKSTAKSVFEIPKNIDFSLKANISHIFYDKLDISNLKGKLLVKDGKAIMDNIDMNMLQGSMSISGEYNTQNIKKPTFAFDINVSGFDIPTAIRSFSMIDKIASSAKEVKGKVSTQFTMTATLDTAMSPILNSINAKGNLQSASIEFTNSRVFGRIADILKNDAFRSPTMKNVNLSFTVKNSHIYIDPFDTKVANIKMNIGGDMGLDQTLNFKARTSIPRATLGVANDLINTLSLFASSKGLNVNLPEDIKMNLKIEGTTTNPVIRPDWGGNPSNESKR